MNKKEITNTLHKIIANADDMYKNKVDKYMKLHLTSMLNNKPKLGFGRTDISESLWKNIHKKRERIKRGSGESMKTFGHSTPQLKKALKVKKLLKRCLIIEKYMIRYIK